MDTEPKSKHTGRKVWYGVAIALSVIVLVISAVGVIGTWILEPKISNATVTLLGTVGEAAGGVRELITQVDQPLGEIQNISSAVSTVSAEVSQEVLDQGILKILLPEEQEQKVVQLVTTVEDTFNSIRSVLSSVIKIYRTIDLIPGINLPKPEEGELQNLSDSIGQVQATIEELRQKTSEIRAGVAEKVSVVTDIANQVTQKVDDTRSKLAALDTKLATLQETVAILQQTLPTILIIIAIFLTLFLSYVVYTQVEMIRLYVQRWHLLNDSLTPIEPPAEAELAPPEEKSE
jgi:hypothetical protein